eukprot:SAG31_NODE_40536_length_280_cov_0.828729_1_plen_60_part_01
MVLAQRDVNAVVSKATAASLADDETWSAEVAEPAIRLARTGSGHVALSEAAAPLDSRGHF